MRSYVCTNCADGACGTDFGIIVKADSTDGESWNTRRNHNRGWWGGLFCSGKFRECDSAPK